MSFADFKRTWRVDDVKETERESLEHRISIGGQGSGDGYDVKVVCLDAQGTHPYAPGIYKTVPERIEGPKEDPYTIKLVRDQDGDKIQLTMPGAGTPTGSWTADDNIGMDD